MHNTTLPKKGENVTSGKQKVIPRKHASTLAPKQTIALETLLLTGSVSQAAYDAGVTPKTIHEWLRQPTFSQHLHRIQTESLDGLSAQLAGTLRTALEIVQKRLASTDEKISLRASEVAFQRFTDILDHISVNKRLTDLEKRVGVEGGEGEEEE